VVAVLRAWAPNGQKCHARHFPLSPSFLAPLVLPWMYSGSSVRLAAGWGCLWAGASGGLQSTEVFAG